MNNCCSCQKNIMQLQMGEGGGREEVVHAVVKRRGGYLKDHLPMM